MSAGGGPRWQIPVAVISVLVAIGGLFFYIKVRYPDLLGLQANSSGTKTKPGATASGKPTDSHLDLNEEEIETKAVAADAKNSPADPDSSEGNKSQKSHSSHHSNQDSGAHSAGALAQDENDDGMTCKDREILGASAHHAAVTKEEWNALLEQFHQAKRILKKWLADNRDQFPEKTAQWMDIRIDQIKVVRPPSSQEEDLNWRGISVMSRSGRSAGYVYVGRGFLTLVMRHPQRSLFELTRLVAQSWTPCDFIQSGLENPWRPVLHCLGVEEEVKCQPSQFSNSGWAVSTAIASELAAPGCQIPALKNQKSCLLESKDKTKAGVSHD